MMQWGQRTRLLGGGMGFRQKAVLRRGLMQHAKGLMHQKAAIKAQNRAARIQRIAKVRSTLAAVSHAAGLRSTMRSAFRSFR